MLRRYYWLIDDYIEQQILFMQNPNEIRVNALNKSFSQFWQGMECSYLLRSLSNYKHNCPIFQFNYQD